MRTPNRLFIVTVLLLTAAVAYGCSGRTPAAPSTLTDSPRQSGQSTLLGAGHAPDAGENTTAADTGSAARGGGATFGSGN